MTDEAVASAPDFGESIARINDLIASGDYSRAIANCDGLVIQSPYAVRALRARAQALERLADFARAQSDYQRVLEITPTDHASMMGQARCMAAQSDMRETAALALQALDYDNTPGAAHYQSGVKLSGLDDSAIHSLGRVRHAWHLFDAGMTMRAISAIRKLLEREPDRSDLRVTLAEMLWRAGRRVAAVELCHDLLVELPDCLTAHAILAQMWQAASMPTMAEAYSERVTMLDPDGSEWTMAVESSRDSVNVRVNPNEAIAVTPEPRAPMSAIAPINPEAMQTRDDSDVPAPHVTPSEDDVEQDDYLNRLIQPEEQSEDFADDVESDPLPISQPLKWKVLGAMSDEPTDTDDDVELDVGDADIGDKSVGDDAIENEIVSDRAPAADAIPHAQDQPAPDEPSAEWITHLQNQTLKYAASQDYEVEPAPLTLSDLQTMPERAEPIAQTPDLAPVTQDEFGVAQKALNAQDYAAVYDALERLVRARKKKTEVIEIIERVLDDSDITLPIMDRAKWYRLLGDAYTRNKQDDRAMRAYQTGLRIAKRSNLNTKK